MTYRWYYRNNDADTPRRVALEGFFYHNEPLSYRDFDTEAAGALIRRAGESDFIDCSVYIFEEKLGEAFEELEELVPTIIRRSIGGIRYVHISDENFVFLKLRFGD